MVVFTPSSRGSARILADGVCRSWEDGDRSAG